MNLLSGPVSHIDAVLTLANAPHLSADRDPIIARSAPLCDYGLDPARPSEARFVPRQVLREHRTGRRADQRGPCGRGAALPAGGRAGLRDSADRQPRHRRAVSRRSGGREGASQDRPVSGLGLGRGPRRHLRGRHLHQGTAGAGVSSARSLQRLAYQPHLHGGADVQPQGQLLAVLDISALHSPPSKDSQTFALQLVKQYARMIEDAYFLRLYRDRPILCFDGSRSSS